MANKEKEFNFKLYGIISFFAVAAVLVTICVTTFGAKYMAFHPEQLAEFFVDTVVQTGDGYNAYKNTLVSKNMKYGDFIRKNYIEPVVKIEGNDYSADSVKGEKTLSDDGTLNGELISRMYPVYEELLNTFGWDDYDSIFTEYIEKLLSVREEIFGDKFFNDEVFFTAFEANVSSYGKSLTGTSEEYDENSGVKLSDKTTGVYAEKFGEAYKITCETVSFRESNADNYFANADSAVLASYGVGGDTVEGAATAVVSVNVNGTVLAECEVALVKIGMSWYVDNLNTDTSVLYFLGR